MVLLPIALSASPLQGASTVVVHCGEDITVYYKASGTDITFYYAPGDDVEVAKTFLVYFRLTNVLPKLSFVANSTSTSLRSLSSALDEYRLSLLQARTLAERYDVNLDAEDLNELATELQRSFSRIADEIEDLRGSLESFLEDPSCNTSFDLNLFDDYDTVYAVASLLLRKAQEKKASLVEENVDLTLVNALSKLITPPFERADLDELKARASSDREVLENVLNPTREDIEKLLEFSQDYEAFQRVSELLSEPVVTEVETFPDVDTAFNYLLAVKDSVRDRDKYEEAKKLYGELKKDLEDGRYEEAYIEAQKLRSLLVKLINQTRVKEEEGGGPNIIPTAGFILALFLLLLFIWKRGKKGGEEDAEPDYILGLDE